MPKRDKKKGKKRKKEELSDDLSVEDLIAALKIERSAIYDTAEVFDNYPLKAPFSYALIIREKDTNELSYIVDEIPLNDQEKEAYAKIKSILEANLEAPLKDESPLESFRRQFPKIIEKHRKLLKGLSNIGVKKIEYYLERNIAGYGKIDPLMADPNIEDISCSGVGRPIYLWHRKYENIKTNIYFKDCLLYTSPSPRD